MAICTTGHTGFWWVIWCLCRWVLLYLLHCLFYMVCTTGRTGFHYVWTYDASRREVLPLFGILLVVFAIFVTGRCSFCCMRLLCLVLVIMVNLPILFVHVVTGCLGHIFLLWAPMGCVSVFSWVSGSSSKIVMFYFCLRWLLWVLGLILVKMAKTWTGWRAQGMT